MDQSFTGGDPEIGENIAQILLPELHDKVRFQVILFYIFERLLED
jgi:hypothetical protein